MKSLLPIRGTRLYVEEYNNTGEEALLYLHGGPGASCVDFCYHQALALSEKVRVIAFDQRGVLRSDPISEGETFGIQDIIEDCEAIRIHLGIRQWTVLGHSFGGYVAFNYAVQYRNSVKRVIFETPYFDIKNSMTSFIQRALPIFQSLEHQEGIKECHRYIEGDFSASDLWNAWGEIGQQLGEHRDHLYFKGMDPEVYNELVDQLVSPGELWEKGQIHINKLQEEGEFFKSVLPKLHKLTQPSLLITGVFDPVCTVEQQGAYRQQISAHSIVTFDNSAHFPRLEEPKKYQQAIINFIEHN
ncbi:alpha/beta hydrolase [Paenibacillus polygoni]|uniref:Alpha/beta hydrolase n=1 Tax=Paenibacillus polygoni TaxID=3050112 RepID=A0ABY8X9C5_9BACL|nr:alpha/beta hydrolase [Paenibacillus polygoni]WIV21076.1 alpha/beta hydrolase [Paenibacillus polygoni]